MENQQQEPWLTTYHAIPFDFMGIYENWCQEFGINIFEYIVLSYLYNHQERATQKMIAEERVIPLKMVDSILKKFEQWGIVEFYTNFEDKRTYLIRLTEIGVETAQKAVVHFSYLEREAYNLMGKDKWETFQSLSLELVNALGEVHEKQNRDNRT